MKLTTLWTLVAALAATQGLAGARAENGASPPAAAVPANPSNIAPTVADAPHRNVEVFGEPRMDTSHPNTIWDEEDIRDLKQMLKTSPGLRQALFELQKTMDDRIGKPIDVPPPQKGPDGAWLYPGDYFPDFPGRPQTPDPVRKFSWFLARDSVAINSLGFLYALTDNEKYAKYARDLLIAYSNLPRYGPSKAIQYRYARGLTNQVLEDALDLESIARGYDLIYNSPALSPADRARIHDDLIQPLAWVMLYPEFYATESGRSFASQINNRGAIGSAAVLLAGYATDDDELVNAALYGTCRRRSANRIGPFPSSSRRRRTGSPQRRTIRACGLLTVHFAPSAIAGGMWVEGTPGYTLYALAALVNAAEAGWRHGLDLYRYNDSILKYVFDYPLLFAYPDLSVPAENNSRRIWLRSIYYPVLYQYGYRRYRDPRYLALINSRDDFGAETERRGLGAERPPPGASLASQCAAAAFLRRRRAPRKPAADLSERELSCSRVWRAADEAGERLGSGEPDALLRSIGVAWAPRQAAYRSVGAGRHPDAEPRRAVSL